MAHSLCRVTGLELYSGNQYDVAVRGAFSRANNRPSLPADRLELFMADQLSRAQRAISMKCLQCRQGCRLFIENFFSEHVALHLHFAEHHFQGADKIRNAVGQGQVDQLDLGRSEEHKSELQSLMRI